MSATGEAWQLDISEDHQALVTLDQRNQTLFEVDLHNYSITGRDELPFDSTLTQYYGQFDYDFGNRILYRHQVRDWGGVSAGGDLEPLPLLLSFDLNRYSEKVILHSEHLLSYFQNVNFRYRVGETIVTGDPNKLWFSAIMLSDNQADVEGVYQLNLNNSEISSIWEFENAIVLICRKRTTLTLALGHRCLVAPCSPSGMTAT